MVVVIHIIYSYFTLIYRHLAQSLVNNIDINHIFLHRLISPLVLAKLSSIDQNELLGAGRFLILA